MRVYTEANFPIDWAMTQNNLGAAYADLPTGDRGKSLRRAIACYKAACGSTPRPTSPPPGR